MRSNQKQQATTLFSQGRTPLSRQIIFLEALFDLAESSSGDNLDDSLTPKTNR